MPEDEAKKKESEYMRKKMGLTADNPFTEANGNVLRANEIAKSWRDKGNRLIEVKPGVCIDPGF